MDIFLFTIVRPSILTINLYNLTQNVRKKIIGLTSTFQKTSSMASLTKITEAMEKVWCSILVTNK